jgi:hypothetical protein
MSQPSRARSFLIEIQMAIYLLMWHYFWSHLPFADFESICENFPKSQKNTDICQLFLEFEQNISALFWFYFIHLEWELFRLNDDARSCIMVWQRAILKIGLSETCEPRCPNPAVFIESISIFAQRGLVCFDAPKGLINSNNGFCTFRALGRRSSIVGQTFRARISCEINGGRFFPSESILGSIFPLRYVFSVCLYTRCQICD